MNDNTPATRRTKFAVILSPDIHDNTKWLSTVICNEGPTYMNAALPYADAYNKANNNLKELFANIPGRTVEIWLIHTTEQTGHEFQLMELSELFATLETIPDAPLTGVQHRTVNL